ncbi:MAG: Glycosyltransferase AglI [Methanoregulaceae archaeon PtaB.Bin056]|nr:MAG: Glycosyltransferase AglI [Methanoregulaceae archaeon PtaB.Bin056]
MECRDEIPCRVLLPVAKAIVPCAPYTVMRTQELPEKGGNTRPLISIVIPNYNGKHFLEGCLSSIAAQTYRDFETILVDNASRDGSVPFVKDRFPWVLVVENPENLGFAGGTNSGIRRAKGRYILTLNNDTRLDPDFLKEVKTAIESDSAVGVVAPKMLLMDGRINSTGMCISLSGAAWNRGMCEDDRGQYDAPGPVIGACAGAALYRRELFDDIGLFDEDFFLYHEDVDLSFRVFLAGWECLYWPKAVVWHENSGTLDYGSDLCIYYVNRNILWFVAKSYPLWLLFSSLPWIIGRNIASVAFYTVSGHVRVIVKSKMDALRGLPTAAGKRSSVRVCISREKVMRYVRTWWQKESMNRRGGMR